MRVRKAKLVSRLPKSIGRLAILLGLIAIAASVTLVIIGIHMGYSLAGLAMAFICFGYWCRWDLSDIPAVVAADNGPLALDQVLASDIVASINADMSPRQVWDSIRNNWEVGFLMVHYELSEDNIKNNISQNKADSTAMWHLCLQLVAQMPVREVTAGVIATAIMVSSPQIVSYIRGLALDTEDIVQGLQWQESLLKRQLTPKKSSVFGGVGRDWSSGFTPILDQYGHNISLEIQNGNQDFSSVSRGHVLEQMSNNLSRPNRGSVALVGDNGVGKSALVYALADQMIRGETDASLQYKQIVQIDPTVITASVTEESHIEQIFEQIFVNTVRAGNIILFFDEAQLFFSNEPGTVNISKILLPILERTGLKCIIALNSQDWHKLTSSNPALSQTFARVDVAQTDEKQTVAILQDIAIHFESQYGHPITYKALQEAYRLSERYIQDKGLPSKAIDLLEDSCNYPVDGFITPESVQQAVEILANTKVQEGDSQEKGQLLQLESLIHERMINQVRAVKVVADALRRSRAGVRNTSRPVGSFLFLGPTGVGKTELAKSLAAVYFGGEDNMIRLDMSEYQTNEDVHRFLSATTEDEAGSPLLEAISQKPFSVVLFDEIEKANPDILDLLLQLLDEGNLTDESGRKVSFKEAIIICTSNAGSDEIRARIEAGQALEQFEQEFTDSIINQHLFKPELINRFDELVLFRPLNKQELLQVAYLMIKEINTELIPKKISIQLTEAAYVRLVEAGYDPRLGARPMRRAVQRLVENTVAKQILSGKVQKGAQITLDVGDLQA